MKKETDRGIVTKKDGYLTITTDEEMDSLRDEFKIPFSCPACNKLMENWDDKFWFKYGVCSVCTINYIEDRDIDESLKRNRPKLLNYIKESIKNKKK